MEVSASFHFFVSLVLLSVMELYHDGILRLEEIVTRTSHNVAKRFGVIERGYLREGYWADLVIVDSRKGTQVSSERVLSKCGWSPFEGETFRSSIVSTLVNGQPVWQDGQIVENDAAARLEFINDFRG
ncbi:MAG: amidohydrolase family protein [Planctomycetales bacterium]